jgi:hypothetical protein
MAFYRGEGGAGSGSVTSEPVSIGQGGTGATTAADARANLGLGTIATQNANGVAITGGSVSGITDLAIADGGTGASTAVAARANLGLATVAATGSYNDLSNTPAIPANLNDLGDVTLSSPSVGQVLKYNGSVWINDADAVSPGDVVGPNGSIDNNIVLFDGTTGLLLKDSGFTMPVTDGTNGQVLSTDGSGVLSFITVGNPGTVTSVDLSVPTGLVVSGNPITSSGTLAVSFDTGYSIPTDLKQTDWDAAYSWGDHALVGYLESTDIGVTVQGYDATTLKSADIGVTVQGYDADTAKYDDVTANFTGTLQNGGSNVVVDTDIGSTVQAYDSNLTSFVGVFTLPTADGTTGQVLTTNGSGTLSFTTISAGTGTVTSVDMTVPTGLTVSGNPITTSGTLALTFSTGYSIPTTSSQSNWDTAYGWGDHASAGYLTSAAIGTTVQAYDAQLADVAGLTPTDSNFIVGDGTNFITESGATARTSLGATTVGSNLFTLTNPSAVTFVRMNADNTVTARSAADFKTDLSLNNVENTALSTWAGSANITTLGTVVTGTISGGTY